MPGRIVGPSNLALAAAVSEGARPDPTLVRVGRTVDPQGEPARQAGAGGLEPWRRCICGRTDELLRRRLDRIVVLAQSHQCRDRQGVRAQRVHVAVRRSHRHHRRIDPPLHRHRPGAPADPGRGPGRPAHERAQPAMERRGPALLHGLVPRADQPGLPVPGVWRRAHHRAVAGQPGAGHRQLPRQHTGHLVLHGRRRRDA